MAVITRFIVVRDGVELDPVFTDKKEAEAYDKMLDAAQDLAGLLKQSDLQIDVDENTIHRISVYLAAHAQAVANILKSVKPVKAAPGDTEQAAPAAAGTLEEKRNAPELKPKPKAKSKAS